MIHQIFAYLDVLDGWLWSTIAIPMVVILGLILNYRSSFALYLKFPQVLGSFFASVKKINNEEVLGVHPLKAFFASIGGCIGIGNIVAVCAAIQIGGPGAIFWMWLAALLGMLIKYSEVYLGIKYRVPNKLGSYDGGPMYYLQEIVKTPVIPILVAVLLTIYGTEIYMFNVITESITENWHVNHYGVISVLLVLIVYASAGGVARVGKISSIIIPFFLVGFSGMSLWVLANHLQELPEVFLTIFKSAFTGHAPLGGFAGSGIMLAMTQGVARGCYTGDIGIGYASIVNAETQYQDPKKQAQLEVLGIFLDTFVVCTLSTLLIIATGVWNQDISASMLVQRALETQFPHMEIFMPVFTFLLGYSSLIAFFCVGLKCAKFIHPKNGEAFYYVYSITAFTLFSFLNQNYALIVMSISGALLLVINTIGIFRMRKDIEI